jgi:hypothetical protein
MNKSAYFIFRLTPDLKALLFKVADEKGITATQLLTDFLNNLKTPKNGKNDI